MNEKEKTEKKRYWLKLEKSFLQSKYIKIIKNMPNGKDYILFYLALMLESIDSVGHLRFTELVPYNEEMLSSLTDINIDIVRSAVKLFRDLGMIEILSDGTIFIPEVPLLTGKECESAERVRTFRSRKAQKLLQCNDDVTKSNANIEEQEQEQEQKQEKKDKKTQAATPKEPKTIYGEFENVLLTDKEYNDKLLAVFGEKQTKAIIEKLSQTKATNAKLKYASDMAAIRKWVIEAVGAKPLPPVTPYVPFLYKIGKPAEAKT